MKKGANMYYKNGGRGYFYAENQGKVVLATYENKQGNEFTHRLNFKTEKMASGFSMEFNHLMYSVSEWSDSNRCIPTTFSVKERWVKINFNPTLNNERGAIKFTFDTSKEVKRFLIHYGAAILGKNII